MSCCLVNVLNICFQAERKTFAYEAFGRDMGRISAGTFETIEKLLRKSLNIGAEWKVLMEAQNIIEELQVMQDIFTQQITVLRDCHKALGSMSWTWNGPDAYFGKQNLTASGVSQQRWAKQALQAPAMDQIATLAAEMEQRRESLASMERMQNKTRSQLRELIDVKQQQSNIIEAKAAIRRADESVLQGRSIVVFTVVTIFFVSVLQAHSQIWKPEKLDSDTFAVAHVFLCKLVRNECP